MNEADKYVITTASSKNVFFVSAIIFVVVAIVAVVMETYILVAFALSLPLLGYPLEAITKNRKVEQIILDGTGIKFTELNRKFLWKDVSSIHVERNHFPVNNPPYYIIIATSAHKRYKVRANRYDIDFTKFKNEVNRLSGEKMMNKKYIDKPFWIFK